LSPYSIQKFGCNVILVFYFFFPRCSILNFTVLSRRGNINNKTSTYRRGCCGSWVLISFSFRHSRQGWIRNKREKGKKRGIIASLVRLTSLRRERRGCRSVGRAVLYGIVIDTTSSRQQTSSSSFLFFLLFSFPSFCGEGLPTKKDPITWGRFDFGDPTGIRRGRGPKDGTV
jgi:hypothetical protein